MKTNEETKSYNQAFSITVGLPGGLRWTFTLKPQRILIFALDFWGKSPTQTTRKSNAKNRMRWAKWRLDGAS